MKTRFFFSAPLLGLSLILGLSGCGGPGGSVMNEADRKNLIKPAEAASGYGQEAEVKRNWAPVAEAAFQRVKSSKLGDHRILAMSYGMSGDFLYDGVALFWSKAGPYRVVRLEAEFQQLDTPIWEVAELPREQGDRFLRQIEGFSPFLLVSDMSLTENVFGEGGAVYFFQWDGTQHEAQVWAPFTLAQRDGSKTPSEILIRLRKLASEVF